MKIAVLSRNPRLYSTRRLVEAGTERGHEMVVIDTLRAYMNIASHKPQIHYRGKPLEGFDAVIPRIGASVTFYGCAVLRQFEMMGVFPLNESVAIARSRDKLRSLQLLSRRGIGLPVTGFAHSPDDIPDLIDMVNGAADGYPPLFRRWHAPHLDAQAWADVFEHAYDQFCARVDAVPDRAWARFERDSLIDPYAADHPSEFFAVCSEALFVRPKAFESEFPELYRLLARYYRQDPAGTGALDAP